MPWSSKGGETEDKEAFVFSLTNEMKVFKTLNPSKAVIHSSWWGPSFDNSLKVYHLINAKNYGQCTVKDSEWDDAKYCV